MYGVVLPTPYFSATSRAVPLRVQRSSTALILVDSGTFLDEEDVIRMRLRDPGASSSTQLDNDWREGYPRHSMVYDSDLPCSR